MKTVIRLSMCAVSLLKHGIFWRGTLSSSVFIAVLQEILSFSRPIDCNALVILLCSFVIVYADTDCSRMGFAAH